MSPLLFGALALWLGQDANWDLRNYHWYNAYAFLNGRETLDLLPSQTPFFYNPLLDVPFYWLGTHVPARVAAFILGTAQGLNLVLLYMLCQATLIIENPRRKVMVCAALAFMGMLGGGGIAQIGATFYDNVTSLGIFTSALLVIRNYDALLNAPWRRACGLAFLMGIPAGLMVGLKLPSVIFCVGLCGALLLTAGSLRRRLSICLAFGCGILAGITVTLGPWAWFLQTHYGSPLFPYFNEVFKSPLAPPTSARDVQFIPTTLSDRLLFPFIFAETPFRVGEIPWRDWGIPALYAALPMVLVIRGIIVIKQSGGSPPPFPTRFLLWMAVITYAVWLAMFAIYRYAIPLEMLSPLLIALTIGMLPLSMKARWIIVFMTLLVIAVTVQPGNWSRRTSWLEHTVEADIPPLPNTAKIMILMAGYEPYSHLVPLFPPKIPFVRIQSNFSNPEDDKGINRVIRARIDAHRAAGGQFKLLIPSWQHDLATDALKRFDMAFSSQSCVTVTDRLYAAKFDLCDVVPINKIVTAKQVLK